MEHRCRNEPDFPFLFLSCRNMSVNLVKLCQTLSPVKNPYAAVFVVDSRLLSFRSQMLLSSPSDNIVLIG